MEEANVGKVTRKFVVKLIIWFLVIDVVLGFAALMMGAGDIEKAGQSEQAMADALNGLMNKLIIVNVAACLLSTFLATRKINKKFSITEDMKAPLFKNITIVLIVMTVLVALIHGAIKNYVLDMSLQEAKVTRQELKQALKDIDKYAKENGLTDKDAKFIESFKGFMSRANIYVFDGIAFLAMIPVEKKLIGKKEN